MTRRAATLAVAALGVGAVMATQPVRGPTAVATSAAASVTVVLSEVQPALQFTLTTTSAGAAEGIDEASLRADIRVDDDGDPATDGAAVVDVGLLPVLDDGTAPPLPADVDGAGDASMASVAEGAFGVTVDLDPARLAVGAPVVLAARLREGVTAARVTFVVTADATFVDGAAGERVIVDVTPRAANGAGT